MKDIILAETEDSAAKAVSNSAHGTTVPSHPLSSTNVPYADTDGVFLSEATAQAMFDELKGDPAFLWEYIEDCCLARAHMMCAIFSARGIYSEKIRADNAAGTWLGSFGLATLKKGESGCFIHMSFHIAPLVRVHTAAGIAERVMDPALFDCPVTQAVWAGALFNRDSIRSDGSIDPDLQDKEFTRLPRDVFENVLYWANKDEDMVTTYKLLARHRQEYERQKQSRREPRGRQGDTAVPEPSP